MKSKLSKVNKIPQQHVSLLFACTGFMKYSLLNENLNENLYMYEDIYVYIYAHYIDK